MRKKGIANCELRTANRQLLLFVALAFCLSSCFKEKPIALPNSAGIGQTALIEMGPEYHDQFFYSLNANSVISQNSLFVYDLMFDCGTNNFNLWLNTAKKMSLVRTNKTDLKTVTINDTIGNDFHYELGEYNVDSNSFGKWWSDSLSTQPVTRGKVYIVDLGVDEAGNPLGFIKMKINDFVNAYSISFASINDTVITNAVITKDDTRNYKYYSLISKAVMSNIEPPKDLWDFCFTRYSIIFYEPYYLPYLVTGVLHNPSRVSAYMDSTVNFDSIKIADFTVGRLQTRRDAVGYEWKRYSTQGTGGNYTPNRNYTYFVKTGEDKYYKLRFIEFLKNGTGDNGYPLFEYFRL